MIFIVSQKNLPNIILQKKFHTLEILKAQGASYKNLTFDSNSTVGNYAGKGNIMAFPTTVLVDKDGNIVGEPFMGGIDDQSNYDQLMKQIQSVLDQK